MALHRAGILDYRVTPSVTAKVAFERYRQLFDHLAIGQAALLEPPADRQRTTSRN
jgi:hypothetical protein